MEKSHDLLIKYFFDPGEWKQDSLTIHDKYQLPVKSVHFGDTGTPFDEKEGRFSVGQLLCQA